MRKRIRSLFRTTLNRYCCCLLLGILSQNEFAFATTATEMEVFDTVQQVTTVSGTVVDESGLPIIGATVVAEKVEGGTVTDDNGKFELTIPGGDKESKAENKLYWYDHTGNDGNGWHADYYHLA